MRNEKLLMFLAMFFLCIQKNYKIKLIILEYITYYEFQQCAQVLIKLKNYRPIDKY